MNKNTSAQDTIYAHKQNTVKSFSFNKQVVDVFPDMIHRSVPGYDHIISGIGQLAAMHCQSGAIIYDLGCSLGAASLSIAKTMKDIDIHIHAVDMSHEMVEKCRENTIAYSYGSAITVHEGDIVTQPLLACDMIILNFTLQFIAKERRQALINKLFDALKPGGLLVMSEKITSEARDIETLIVNLHHDFKRANGYSDLEISQKRTALEDVMKLDSIETHHQRLKTAGFTSSAVWQQQYNFMSLLAKK